MHALKRKFNKACTTAGTQGQFRESWATKLTVVFTVQGTAKRHFLFFSQWSLITTASFCDRFLICYLLTLVSILVTQFYTSKHS